MAMEHAGANHRVVNGYQSLHRTSTTADLLAMSWNICRIQTRNTMKIEMWSKRVVAPMMSEFALLLQKSINLLIMDHSSASGRSFDTGPSEDAMSINDDHSQGTCSDIDCDESSNHSYASETPISIPENFVFDEEADDDEYLHLSLEDIAAQLDAWANSEADGDFYDIC
jgi:hypothetical protein